MAGKIQWLTSLEEGKKRAAEQKRAILVDFFNPG